jgi:hypothetical protein
MERFWRALAPHKNVFTLTSPGEISSNIAIPKPVIATFSNFLSSKKGRDNYSPEHRARFQAFLKGQL